MNLSVTRKMFSLNPDKGTCANISESDDQDV
jgi:hypothetical protein